MRRGGNSDTESFLSGLAESVEDGVFLSIGRYVGIDLCPGQISPYIYKTTNRKASCPAAEPTPT